MSYPPRPLPPRGTARKVPPAVVTPPVAPPAPSATPPAPAPLAQANFLAGLLDREIIVESLAGVERRGRLRRFDQFSLVLLVDGRETLVYKHSIGAICAAPPPREGGS